MKSFDKMTKEELYAEANIARKAAVNITCAVYKYLGEEISKKELLNYIDKIINPQLTDEFKHKYIIKDYLGVCGQDLDRDCDFDDLDLDMEELKLKED